ncbi:hypothetical protein [Ferribacterium limneticum]|uniref:hypothetical protein n=1 Tax=Ferribacterium limneticum TaxID=76259 RepID=UPI001CF85C93|nr:hypothetical protein [Ferribacterium limneticum]UCV22199.1 hypothetical protein KI613_16975 [Ferribacterium limneticum]
MKFAFAFAGIPTEVFDSVAKEAKFITGGGNTSHHFIKHGPDGTPYREFEVRQLVNTFKPYIEQETREKDKDTGEVAFAVFYIRDQESDFVIRDNLFPFLITIPINWELDYSSELTLRQSKNELVRQLNTLCIDARKLIVALQRELVEQRQRTPWLLPIRNFRSRHLVPGLYEIQDQLIMNEKKPEALSKLTDAFRHHHPPQKRQDSHKSDRRYFVDDSGVMFKPPGKDLHGFHKPSDGHNEICAISSQRRLGVPYHRALHYDCSKGDGATELNLYSCHRTELAPISSEKHINIATNDYTRPEK